MSKRARDELKKSLHDAELTELDDARLEEVAGGVCGEGCNEGCSMCCSPGSANREKLAM